jgi:hypothetical protein
MPTIISPAGGTSVAANAISVQVSTQSPFVCLYITEKGNPANVLAGPNRQQAVNSMVTTTWNVEPHIGKVDFYACDSADGNCQPTPGGNCPSVTITLT